MKNTIYSLFFVAITYLTVIAEESAFIHLIAFCPKNKNSRDPRTLFKFSIVLHCFDNKIGIQKIFNSYPRKSVAIMSSREPSEVQTWFELAGQGLPVMVPHPNDYHIISNKAHFTNLFLTDPKISRFLAKIYNSPTEVTFPVFYERPPTEAYKQKLTIATNTDQLSSLVKDLSPEAYVLQEAIPGNILFTFYFAAIEGTLLESEFYCKRTLLKEDYAIFYAGGKTKFMEHSMPCATIPNWKIAFHIMMRMIKRVKFNGLGCFEFKVLADTHLPRIWEVVPHVCPGLPERTMAKQVGSWLDQYYNETRVALVEERIRVENNKRKKKELGLSKQEIKKPEDEVKTPEKDNSIVLPSKTEEIKETKPAEEEKNENSGNQQQNLVEKQRSEEAIKEKEKLKKEQKQQLRKIEEQKEKEKLELFKQNEELLKKQQEQADLHAQELLRLHTQQAEHQQMLNNLSRVLVVVASFATLAICSVLLRSMDSPNTRRAE